MVPRLLYDGETPLISIASATIDGDCMLQYLGVIFSFPRVMAGVRALAVASLRAVGARSAAALEGVERLIAPPMRSAPCLMFRSTDIHIEWCRPERYRPSKTKGPRRAPASRWEDARS